MSNRTDIGVTDELSVDSSCVVPRVAPVSVIIPAYNAAPYLAEAVASVRAQTLPPREIVVVDDGSSDATCLIAKSLGVTLLEQLNRGVSAARNAGVQAATSPWVAFLDADDLWEPTKLERQWRALEAVPSSFMSFTGSTYFNDEGELPGGLDAIADFRRVRLVPTDIADTFLCEPASYATTLAHVNFIVHASILVSREIFVRTGGYDESMRYSEDLDWILRAAALTSVVVVTSPLTKIRTHTTNSSRNWDRMILSHVGVGVKAEQYPELYPPGVAAEFVRLRPQFYFEAGMCLLRSLDVAEATRRFSDSWQQRRNVRAGVMLVCMRFMRSPLGSELLARVRHFVKHGVRRREYS